MDSETHASFIVKDMAKPIRKNPTEWAPPVDEWNPDRILNQYPKGTVKLNLRLLERGGGEDGPDVLIEGSKKSLQALARVILAVAADEDCGYGFSPKAAGNAHFSKKSELGIYIHRLPCMNKRLSRHPGQPL